MFRNAYSPVPSQGMIWLGEYDNCTHLAEFAYDPRKPNRFQDIDRTRLVRFGLVGHGTGFYFEVYGGVFKLNGVMVELIYRTRKKDYYLTGQQQMYNDIITYKDAISDAQCMPDGSVQASPAQIVQYSVGYKTEIAVDNVKFQVRALCKLPVGGQAHMNVRLVANRSMKGDLLFVRNGEVIATIFAPLSRNEGGEVCWVVQ